MENLKPSSQKLFGRIPKWIIFAFILISFLGFLDASYLTAEHYLGAPLPCSILDGCEEVTTSKYSTIWNVPVALLGAIYYSLIFFLAIAYLDTRRDSIIRLAAYLTPLGFLASAWFVYLQLFVIKALCLYCIISAVTSIILFILGMIMLKYHQVRIRRVKINFIAL